MSEMTNLITDVNICLLSDHHLESLAVAIPSSFVERRVAMLETVTFQISHDRTDKKINNIY